MVWKEDQPRSIVTMRLSSDKRDDAQRGYKEIGGSPLKPFFPHQVVSRHRNK